MSLELKKAGTSDALTLTGISKRSFASDVEVGAPAVSGPPGYNLVSYHVKMAGTGHLYKLTDNGLIVGGAVLSYKDAKVDIIRIFVSPEHFRKGYGLFMMQEIETMFSEASEFKLDTPAWNVRTNSFYKKIGYTEVKRKNEFVVYSKKP